MTHSSSESPFRGAEPNSRGRALGGKILDGAGVATCANENSDRAGCCCGTRQDGGQQLLANAVAINCRGAAAESAAAVACSCRGIADVTVDVDFFSTGCGCCDGCRDTDKSMG